MWKNALAGLTCHIEGILDKLCQNDDRRLADDPLELRKAGNTVFLDSANKWWWHRAPQEDPRRVCYGETLPSGPSSSLLCLSLSPALWYQMRLSLKSSRERDPLARGSFCLCPCDFIATCLVEIPKKPSWWEGNMQRERSEEWGKSWLVLLRWETLWAVRGESARGGGRVERPAVPPSAPGCFPPSQGRGWHSGGITFQGSEVEFRTILSSWSELCFLPRQNWQSMGKFYFERWNLSRLTAAEKFWMGKSRDQNSLSLPELIYSDCYFWKWP